MTTLVTAIARQSGLRISRISQREWAYERGFRYRITGRGGNTKMYARNDSDALQLIRDRAKHWSWS